MPVTKIPCSPNCTKITLLLSEVNFWMKYIEQKILHCESFEDLVARKINILQMYYYLVPNLTYLEHYLQMYAFLVLNSMYPELY